MTALPVYKSRGAHLSARRFFGNTAILLSSLLLNVVLYHFYSWVLIVSLHSLAFLTFVFISINLSPFIYFLLLKYFNVLSLTRLPLIYYSFLLYYFLLYFAYPSFFPFISVICNRWIIMRPFPWSQRRLVLQPVKTIDTGNAGHRSTMLYYIQTVCLLTNFFSLHQVPTLKQKV